MDFRSQPKTRLTVLIPVDIEDAIRDRSKRRSLSEVTTELLGIALGRDPGDYGITASRTRRTNRRPTPAA